MKKLYGAYGSNLSQEQMSHRCPFASLIGTAVLDGWRLCFKKSGSGAYLSIVPDEGSEVPLGIYEIDQYDEKRLDRYEGYPRFYRKKAFTLPIQTEDGEIIPDAEIMVYVMNDDRPYGRPDLAYYDVCYDGYQDFGFDPNILIDAAHETGIPLRLLVERDQLLTCPKCGNPYSGHPAISRRDNRTLICPECGARQAMESLNLREDDINVILKRIRDMGGFEWEDEDDD